MRTTAFDLAQRFIGVEEAPGSQDDHLVMAMLRLDDQWPEHDEVPWCSAFCNFVAWLLRLPRSKSLRARSWLRVGKPVEPDHAWVGWDIVVLSRGADPPGADVIDAPGHVGFYAGHSHEIVYLLGGNQGNQVSIASYPLDRLLGIRRLYEE